MRSRTERTGVVACAVFALFASCLAVHAPARADDEKWSSKNLKYPDRYKDIAGKAIELLKGKKELLLDVVDQEDPRLPTKDYVAAIAKELAAKGVQVKGTGRKLPLLSVQVARKDINVVCSTRTAPSVQFTLLLTSSGAPASQADVPSDGFYEIYDQYFTLTQQDRQSRRPANYTVPRENQFSSPDIDKVVDDSLKNPQFKIESDRVLVDSKITGRVGMAVVVGDKALAVAPDDEDKQPSVRIKEGEDYNVVLYNYSAKHELAVKLFIDGLDVAFLCKPKLNYFIVPRASGPDRPGEMRVRGYYKDLQTYYTFRLGKVGDIDKDTVSELSDAEKRQFESVGTDNNRQLHVISAMVYGSADKPEDLRQFEDERKGSDNPPQTIPGKKNPNAPITLVKRYISVNQLGQLSVKYVPEK